MFMGTEIFFTYHVYNLKVVNWIILNREKHLKQQH